MQTRFIFSSQILPVLLALLMMASACANLTQAPTAVPTQAIAPESTAVPTKAAEPVSTAIQGAESTAPAVVTEEIVAPTEAPSSTSDAMPEPSDDRLNVALGVEILSLDTHRSTGTPAETVRKHIYEGLVFANEQNEISPRLATEWKLSEDQKTWTFKLRSDVTFHDGTPFNAQAVKVNLDRLANPDLGLERHSTYQFIESVAVVDDLTVAITTKTPFGPFLAYMAFGGGSFMSPAALEQWGADIGAHPVGTGPYMFKEQIGGESVTLERYDNYWGNKPYFKEIVFTVVKEDATRANLLETGQMDFIVNLPAQDIANIADNPELKVRTDPSTRVAHIGINTTKGPLQDVRVRQALNYAVDTAAIVKGVLSGVGIPATSVVSPVTWGFADISRYQYDPDKAKQLLSEAGYPQDITLSLWTPSGRYFMDKQTTEAVQGMLDAVGVKTELRTADWASYLAEIRKANDAGNAVDLYMLGWESTTGEAGYIAETIFTSKNFPMNGWNTMFYSNPAVDELVAQAQASTDEVKRKELLAEFQKIVMEDAVWIPLYVSQQVSAHRADLEGSQVFPNDTMLFSNAYLKK